MGGFKITVCDLKGPGQHPKYLPYAFTEHGALMLGNVLKSDRAETVSVEVVRAFIRLREILAANADFAKRLEELERKHEVLAEVSDQNFKAIIAKIREMMELPADAPRKQIGFKPGEDAGTK